MKRTFTTAPPTRPANRILITMLCAGLLVFAPAQWFLAPNALAAQQSYEAYYRYVNDYPENSRPGWHVDVQGITHDAGNWFITQTEKLWKISVTHNINVVRCGDAGVTCKTLSDYPELTAAGYEHMGDPEFFEFKGQGFLLIPLEFGPVAIAAFRADTLEYIDHALIPGQTLASWCAVDPQGVVYSTNSDGVTAINRFVVNWDALKNRNQMTLSPAPPLPLAVTLEGVQGGVVTPSGELLYMVANGIHVFDLSSGQRIKQSTNGSGLFNFDFDASVTTAEEPEGLTIWDLDNGQAPGIRGQLHVLLLDNNWPENDEVYLKHYTNTLHVDQTYSGFETGQFQNPFKTVAAALAFAWDGARIRIREGSYNEAMTITRRVQMVSRLGTAIIGQ